KDILVPFEHPLRGFGVLAPVRLEGSLDLIERERRLRVEQHPDQVEQSLEWLHPVPSSTRTDRGSPAVEAASYRRHRGGPLESTTVKTRHEPLGVNFRKLWMATGISSLG